MRPQLSPSQRQALGADLQARRHRLDKQRSAHLGGSSRAEHGRAVLWQVGDDATQRDAAREVDFARSDRDAVSLADFKHSTGKHQTAVAARIVGDGPVDHCSDKQRVALVRSYLVKANRMASLTTLTPI